jgi:hypothetical protein
MTERPIQTRKELAHRATDGIEVTLFWMKPTTRVVIAVSDAHFGESFEFEVEGESALDAFRHPYAYAAARHCHATEDGSMSPNCSRKAHVRATEAWLPSRP